jgi:hypothetical protein
LGGQQAAGLLDDGSIILLRFTLTPSPFLADVARFELGEPATARPASGDGLYAVIDRSQRVSLFESERLEPLGRRTFDAGLTNRPFLAGRKLFVEEGAGQLHCLAPEGELPSLWSIDLKGSTVAGVIERAEEIVIAQRNGRVAFVDPTNGNIVRELETQTPVSQGPLVASGKLFVGANDGTLILLRE